VKRQLAYVACGLTIVLACGAYYRALWPSYDAFSRAIDPACMVEYCDFTLYYYKEARQIRRSDTPIKKYFYSPAFALLLVPIGELPLASAQALWTWLELSSLVLLIAASVLLLRGAPRWTHALVLLLTLTSYPVLHNHKWGQANTALIALVMLALVLFERGLLALAGLALAGVAAARYYPAMYAIAFCARGGRKALAWFVALTLGLLIALPGVMMGAEHARHFFEASAASIAHEHKAWISGSHASQFLPTALMRLARALHQRDVFGTRSLWVGIAAALAACNTVVAAWAVLRGMRQRTLWAFCFMALSTPLLLPTSWMHYFVYLPLVQTFLVAELWRLHGRRGARISVFLMFWMPSTILPSIFFFQSTDGARAYARQGHLLIADLLLLALAYCLLVMRRSAPGSTRHELGSVR
jgi:hypothetical protein